MRGHPGAVAPVRQPTSHAPRVTRAMATHGLQPVLWTPWPQTLQCTSSRRYCSIRVGYRYRSHLHMWDRRTCARRSARCPPRASSATVSGQSAPNPMICVSSYCQLSLSSPLDSIQANGKLLVSSTRAQTTNIVHGPDRPPRGCAEAMWGWRRNRSSKAGKVLYMRSHEACCFSMMRTNVHDALVAMG